jgi:hypothetical protein
MITAYFGNDICSLCHRKCQADGSNPVVVCKQCKKERIKSLQRAASLLNEVQDSAKMVAIECSKCNGCFESEDTFGVLEQSNPTISASCVSVGFLSKSSKTAKQSLVLPLANCVCIDCPNLYRRHRLREQGIEAQGTWDALVRDNP